MATFDERVYNQLDVLKKLEDGLPARCLDAEEDVIKAQIAIARSNILIAEALDRVASRIK